MSKAARPSLSDVLPVKGAATRTEPLPDVDGDQTVPPAAPVHQAGVGEGRGKTRVVRIPLTVKVSETVYRRLREAAFREEVDKQDLVDRALDALLTSMGY